MVNNYFFFKKYNNINKIYFSELCCITNIVDIYDICIEHVKCDYNEIYVWGVS